MALVKCAECGRQVSSLAKACPACGAPPPAPSEPGQMWVDDKPLLSQVTSAQALQQGRKVGLLLALGIIFMPLIFAWFTLRQGYGSTARVLAFGWLALLIVSTVMSNNSGLRPVALDSKPASTSTTSDPISRCSQFLGVAELKGVDVQQVFGAPSSMFGRAQWCQTHADQFQGK